MVQEVVDTVENYCEEGRFPEPFATRIHKDNLSFNEARNVIHDTIRQEGIQVRDRVDLLTNKVWKRVTKTTTTHNVHNVANTVTNVENTTVIPVT
jgi:hypothetical protein